MRVRMELFAKIRRDARVEGVSIRGLAKLHQVGRDTVRQALSDPVPPARKRPVRSSPKLEPFKAAIDAMLVEDTMAPRKQRHTARRILARLVEEYGAQELSYSTVRDLKLHTKPKSKCHAEFDVYRSIVVDTRDRTRRSSATSGPGPAAGRASGRPSSCLALLAPGGHRNGPQKSLSAKSSSHRTCEPCSGGPCWPGRAVVARTPGRTAGSLG